MSLVKKYLDKIKNAIYGREVRQSIVDAIDQCYKDATGNPESVAAVIDEINDINDNIKEINSEVDEFQEQVERVVANATSGSESATNSEIVTARKGEISLGTRLDKLETGERLKKKSISADKLSFIDANVELVNIYNPELSEIGGINYSTGIDNNDSSESTKSRTNYIAIKDNGLIIFDEPTGLMKKTKNRYVFLYKTNSENGLNVSEDKYWIINEGDNRVYLQVPNGYNFLRFVDSNIASGSEVGSAYKDNLKVYSIRGTLNSELLKEDLEKSYNPMKDKTIVFAGNSITTGYTPAGVTLKAPFPEKIRERLHCNAINKGIGATKIASPVGKKTDNDFCQPTRYTTFVYPYGKDGVIPDIICIFGGINDHTLDSPLGKLTDNDETTFYGALKVMLRGILGLIENDENARSKTKVCMFTPLHRFTGTHPYGKFGTNSSDYFWNRWTDVTAEGNMHKNNLGFRIKDYVTAIKEVCSLYGIPVLDLYSCSAIPSFLFDIDGVHCTQETSDNWLVTKICDFLNSGMISEYNSFYDMIGSEWLKKGAITPEKTIFLTRDPIPSIYENSMLSDLGLGSDGTVKQKSVDTSIDKRDYYKSIILPLEENMSYRFLIGDSIFKNRARVALFDEEPTVGMQAELAFNNDTLCYDDEMEFVITNTASKYAMITFFNDIFEYDETPTIIIQKSIDSNFIDTYSLSDNIKLNEKNFSEVNSYKEIKKRTDDFSSEVNIYKTIALDDLTCETGTLELNNNILSVKEMLQTRNFIKIQYSERIKFIIRDVSYIIIGNGVNVQGKNVETTICLKHKDTKIIGYITEWYDNDEYYNTVKSLNVSPAVNGDEIEIVNLIDKIIFYKNSTLWLEINKQDYPNNYGLSNSVLGFMVTSNTDELNIAEKIQIKESTKKIIENINDTVKDLESNFYEEETIYKYKDITIDDINYSNGIVNIKDNKILELTEEPTLKYDKVTIATKTIRFTILDTNIIVLGTNGNNYFTTICLKHTNSSFIGCINDFDIKNNSTKTKYSLGISPCKEGDEILVDITEETYKFKKNGEYWFEINKQNYPNVENWIESKFGFLVAPTMYSNLAKDLQKIICENKNISFKESIQQKIDSLNNKIYLGEGNYEKAVLNNFEVSTGNLSISDTNAISVSDVQDTFGYVAIETNKIRFNIKNTNYALLGVNKNDFVTICLKHSKTKLVGYITKWSKLGTYTNYFPKKITPCLEGDTIEVSFENEKYTFLLNGSFWFEIDTNEYLNLTGWENKKLGFFIAKDLDNQQIADNIEYYNLYSESLDYKVSNLEKNIIYEYRNKQDYTEAQESDFAIYNDNSNNGITLNNNSLNCSPISTSYTAIVLQEKKNSLKFNILNATHIVLGTQENSYSSICIKECDFDTVGNLSECSETGLYTKYTLSIESCNEDDEIIINIENGIYTFQKNGAFWFEIKKSTYPQMIRWESEKLGFMASSSNNTSLAKYIKLPVTTQKIVYLKDEVEELKNIVSGSKWAGKRFGFLGDSLMAGYGNPNNYSFVIKLAELLGLESYDLNAISGSTVSNVSTTESATCMGMAERYVQLSECDAYMIFGGTNDYGMRPCPIGEKTDDCLTTFYGALNILLKGMMEKFPGKPIYFLTPLHRQKDKVELGEDTLPNKYGHNLNDYREAIIDRCLNYGVKYIDCFQFKFNPNIEAVKALYFQDAAHLNVLGADEFALTLVPILNVY